MERKNLKGKLIEEDIIQRKIDKAKKVRVIPNFLAWTSLIIGIIIISLVTTFYFCSYMPFKNMSLNELGDFVGGTVGTLFSISGLLFIYVAFQAQKEGLLHQSLELFYNKEDLQLTRDELVLNRQEMKLSRLEQKTLNETASYQRFEEMWNNQLKSFFDNLSEISLEFSTHKKGIKENYEISGRSAFKKMNDLLFSEHPQDTYTDAAKSMEDCRIFYHDYYEMFSHLNRHLAYLIKFVFDSGFDEGGIFRYCNMILYRLSSYELIYFMYTTYTNERERKLKKDMIDLNFFNKFNTELLHHKLHINYYTGQRIIK